MVLKGRGDVGQVGGWGAGLEGFVDALRWVEGARLEDLPPAVRIAVYYVVVVVLLSAIHVVLRSLLTLCARGV